MKNQFACEFIRVAGIVRVTGHDTAKWPHPEDTTIGIVDDFGKVINILHIDTSAAALAVANFE